MLLVSSLVQVCVVFNQLNLSKFCKQETAKCRGSVDVAVFERYREAAVEVLGLLL